MTRAQWADEGCVVRAGSEAVTMHPSMFNDLTCDYYHADDVMRVCPAATAFDHVFETVPEHEWDAGDPVIDGVRVDALSERDGLPLRGSLPEGLAGRFQTQRNWMEQGMFPKSGARSWPMHCQRTGGKVYAYLIDSDVAGLTPDDDPCTCCTCKYREQSGFCMWSGSRTTARGYCTSWGSRYGFEDSECVALAARYVRRGLRDIDSSGLEAKFGPKIHALVKAMGGGTGDSATCGV